MSRNDEKKEKVIHTRISEALEQTLKERASGLGVSMSNLVRNVLQSTFGVVEGVMSDGASMARSVREAARPPGRESTPLDAQEVIGWQELILNLNAVCAVCNGILPKGSSVAIAVTMSGHSVRHVLCPSCLRELREQVAGETEEGQAG